MQKLSSLVIFLAVLGVGIICGICKVREENSQVDDDDE